jgi:hypothetical protein
MTNVPTSMSSTTIVITTRPTPGSTAPLSSSYNSSLSSQNNNPFVQSSTGVAQPMRIPNSQPSSSINPQSSLPPFSSTSSTPNPFASATADVSSISYPPLAANQSVPNLSVSQHQPPPPPSSTASFSSTSSIQQPPPPMTGYTMPQPPPPSSGTLSSSQLPLSQQTTSAVTLQFGSTVNELFDSLTKKSPQLNWMYIRVQGQQAVVSGFGIGGLSQLRSALLAEQTGVGFVRVTCTDDSGRRELLVLCAFAGYAANPEQRSRFNSEYCEAVLKHLNAPSDLPRIDGTSADDMSNEFVAAILQSTIKYTGRTTFDFGDGNQVTL